MAYLKRYQPDSLGVFQPFWQCWRFLGVFAWQKRNLCILYDIAMILLIYIWYPVHLTVGLMLLPLHHDIYKNLSMNITCIVCTLKHICVRWKFTRVNEMMTLFAKLDERVLSAEERKYFIKKSMRTARLVAKMYFTVYMGANVSALMSVLLDAQKRLIYPAWFPFDWSSSTAFYYLALLYQFVGVTILIVANFTNDAISPVTLCLFSGHVRLLSMRVSKLGYDKTLSSAEHANELKLCIEDHINLIRLFYVVQDFLSPIQLILFISSGLNICVVLVYLFFFVDNLFACIYYTIFLFAIAVELFPIYYFGSVLQQEFSELPYAIFSSNWPSQTRSYRQSVLIFNEVALRKMTISAGGIVDNHLDSFFAICKMTYSLFAVVMRMK